MNDRVIQRRVGFVVIATVIIASLLVAYNSGPLSWTRGQYQIKVLLDSAPGVGENTPVRKNGVLIGRVDSVEFPDGEQVLLTLSINGDTKILDTDVCRVQPSSILGDAVISFVSQKHQRELNSAARPEGDLQTIPPQGADRSTLRSRNPPRARFVSQLQPQQPATPPPSEPPPPVRQPQEIEPGATIRGEVVPSPVDLLVNIQADVGPAIESLGRAGDEVARLAERLNRAIGDQIEGERIPRLLDTATVAMENFSETMNKLEGTMETFDQVFGDPEIREELRRAVRDAPKLIDESRTAIAQVQQTTRAFDNVIAGADRNLRNIEGLTRPLGERGPELASMLASSVENLDLTMANAARFTQSLTDSRGAFARLLNDPQLYDNVNRLVCNADTVVRQVYALIDNTKTELRQTVENVKVFTDKIAREPGRLIGGAVNPSFIK